MKMPMPMYLYWSTESYIIFKSFSFDLLKFRLYIQKDSNGSFILACALIAIFCFLSEYLPLCRFKLRSRMKERLIGEDKSGFNILLEVIVYGLQYLVAAIIMLLLMTFNGWIIIAIILGKMAGFYLFRSGRDTISEGDCH